MASTSKNVTSQSSDRGAVQVKEAVSVQSEEIKNKNDGNCAADGIPIHNASKKITLNSYDGEAFEVEEAVAAQSEMLKNMIEDNCTDNGIPIPNVNGETLSKVLEYCKKHVDDKSSTAPDEVADIKNWDAQFVKDLDQYTLYDLILAANFLNIKSLLDLLCQKVADMIKGKMPDEIRKMFNIKNDFTPEEEAKIISENAWAFQKEA